MAGDAGLPFSGALGRAPTGRAGGGREEGPSSELTKSGPALRHRPAVSTSRHRPGERPRKMRKGRQGPLSLPSWFFGVSYRNHLGPATQEAHGLAARSAVGSVAGSAEDRITTILFSPPPRSRPPLPLTRPCRRSDRKAPRKDRRFTPGRIWFYPETIASPRGSWPRCLLRCVELSNTCLK